MVLMLLYGVTSVGDDQTRESSFFSDTKPGAPVAYPLPSLYLLPFDPIL